jgi:hypothetical protein
MAMVMAMVANVAIVVREISVVDVLQVDVLGYLVNGLKQHFVNVMVLVQGHVLVLTGVVKEIIVIGEYVLQLPQLVLHLHVQVVMMIVVQV